MNSDRLFFDPSCRGNMMFIRNADPLFRGPRTVMNMEETSKRRLFFSSPPDDLYDEEYYDEQSPEKKRRLTPEQVLLLEKSFETENKLEPERKTQLAKNLGLQPRQVAVWFQNRRARWKTKQLERDYDHLKSSYDSLLSDCDSILKHNQKLKAEVVSLTEKLQSKEVTGQPLSGPEADPLPVDRLSTGSGGSAVVDEEGLQLLDSGDSYFPTNDNPKCVGPLMEDRISTGRGESAVVDEEGPQLVDSGDPYFPINDYPKCVDPLDGVQSEEDDVISDEGQNYFPDEEGETLAQWLRVFIS